MSDSLYCTDWWSHSVYYPAAFLNILMKHSRIFSSSKKYFTSQSCPVRPLPGPAAELGLTLSVSGGEGGRGRTRGWGRMVRRGSRVVAGIPRMVRDTHWGSHGQPIQLLPNIQYKQNISSPVQNSKSYGNLFLLLNISVNLAENISINLSAVSWHVSARCAVEWILYQILPVMTPSHSPARGN